MEFEDRTLTFSGGYAVLLSIPIVHCQLAIGRRVQTKNAKEKGDHSGDHHIL